MGITKHNYYYRPSNGKKGRSPTVLTRKVSGETTLWVKESELIDEIITIKSDPETDYGYRAMAAALQIKGYLINKKKVYRLMKKYQLLHEKPAKSVRTYVKHRDILE